MTNLIGAKIERKEDKKFLTGKGKCKDKREEDYKRNI